jgi:hypothetical protein
MAATLRQMEDRRVMLSNFPLIVKDEGLIGLRSCEELKDLIARHFGFRKHKLYAYRSCPNPFVAVFSDQHMRDVVFAVGRAIEEPIELSFSAWDLMILVREPCYPFMLGSVWRGCRNMPGRRSWLTESSVTKQLCTMWRKALGRRWISERSIVGRSAKTLRVFHRWSFSLSPPLKLMLVEMRRFIL